ncbi:MAG: tetratricopeptide repeat protein [Bacteroidales bacterium]|nr:tetratricopeptide repeat protein [Bacteroidales bacterium]
MTVIPRIMRTISRQLFLILFGLLFSVSIYSQNKIDSLKNVLNSEISDTSKISTLKALSTVFLKINKDTAVYYALKAYALAVKTKVIDIVASAACNLADVYYYKDELNYAINYYKIAAEYEKKIHGEISDEYAARLGDIGYCFFKLGIYDISVSYFEKSLEIVRKTKNLDEVYTNINNIGLVYHTWGEYDKAIIALSEVLEFDLKQNNYINISSSYNNIGKIYETWGIYKQATDYYTKALDYSKKTNNLSQIAVRYSNLGMVSFKLGNFDLASEYLIKAIELDLKEGNLVKVAVRQNELGRIIAAKGDYKLAVDYNMKALNTFRKAGIQSSQSIVYKDLGDIYRKMKQYSLSETNYLAAVNISKEIGSIDNELYAYKGLSELFKITGHFQKSLLYYMKYDSLSTIIFNKENNKQILAFDIKYETEKKEKEIELLKNEAIIKDVKLSRSKIVWISLLVISVLLISIAIILIKRNKLKTEINKILKEKNKQLNILNATKTKFFAIISHDLLNPLSAIHTLTNAIETSFNNIDKDQLLDFIKELNKSSEQTYLLLQNLLAWASLNNGRMKYIPEYVNLNIPANEVISVLQINADEKKISINTDIPDNIVAFIDKLMISTVLRNLVSNAIKFSSEKSLITVFAKVEDKMIIISVKDNGVGMSKKDVSKLFRIDVESNAVGNHPEKGTGLGLILCKELTEKCGGKIWAKSELNKGSEFIFTVPRKKQ